MNLAEYAVMFILVTIMGAGIPGPGDASLIAAGALAGEGKLNIWIVLATATVAWMLGSVIGFVIGDRGDGLCSTTRDAWRKGAGNCWPRATVPSAGIPSWRPRRCRPSCPGSSTCDSGCSCWERWPPASSGSGSTSAPRTSWARRSPSWWENRHEGADRRDHPRCRGAVDQGRVVEVARQPPSTTSRAGHAQDRSQAGLTRGHVSSCSARGEPVLHLIRVM